jgi:hypothetical protein
MSEKTRRPLLRLAGGAAAGIGLGLIYSFASRALGST